MTEVSAELAARLDLEIERRRTVATAGTGRHRVA
jgi:hypothetical protein